LSRKTSLLSSAEKISASACFELPVGVKLRFLLPFRPLTIVGPERRTNVSILKAIWTNGQVVLEGHADWPEGRRLIVQEEILPGADFMTEDEQSGDEEAIQQWIDDLRTIPPVPEDPARESEWQAWEEKMRLFNIEAVRKQFEERTP
jgi:hypothetical protein